MDILIEYDYDAEELEALPVEEFAQFVLEHQDVPSTTQVSITFVDNARMAELNEEFRGCAGPTDVLSFECDGLDDEDGFADAASPDEPFLLGDVIIAPDVAHQQCELYGTTFEQEITLLLCHGLLHLCGYDHIEDDDAREMQEQEAAMLSPWFRSRGADERLVTEPIAYVESLVSRVVRESALPKTPDELPGRHA